MEDRFIEEQKKIIMNRIQKYEDKKRKNFKPMILVAAILLIFMMPLFSNSSTSFGITQISANEYTLNIFGDKVHFKFYVLTENQNKIPVNDEMSYYEGFQKYFDITAKFKLEPIEMDGYLFLKLMKGDEVVKYLYVDNYDEHTRSIQLIERKFSDFESEMGDIIETVKAYPYEVTLETERGPLIEENKKSYELDDQAIEGYRWFKEMQLRVWSSDPIDEYEFVLYIDGEGDTISIGHVIGQSSEVLPVDFKVKPTGTLSGYEEINGVKVSSYKYLFEEIEGIPWVSGMKIDFGDLNPDDYELQVEINKEVVPMQWELKDHHIVYLTSEFLPLNETVILDENQNEVDIWIDMRIEVLIVDKVTGEVLVDYSDYNSMHPRVFEED